MAKCKLCKTDIPDGSTYCEDCLEKNAAKSNESYLDSLLNSVKNTVPATETVYKKSNHDNKQSTNTQHTESSDDNQSLEDMFSIDFDIEDLDHFDDYDITKDLEDDVEISEEDLFGDALKEETLINHSTNQEAETQDKSDMLSQSNVSENEIDNFKIEEEQDPILSDLLYQLDVSDTEDEYKETENIKSEVENNMAEETIEPLSQDKSNSVDSNLEEENEQDKEYNHMDDLYKSILNQPEEYQEATTQEDSQAEEESLEEADDDLLDLLNQISSDDPASDDIQAISALLSGKTPAPKQEDNDLPSDVGEVFSDALKAVSSLTDSPLEEQALNLLEEASKKKGKKDKKEKKTKAKKEKVKKQKETPSEKPTTTKKGFMDRLFGDTEEEETDKSSSKTKKELAAADEKPKKKKASKGKAASEDNKEEDKSKKAKKQKKASKSEQKKEKKEKKKKNKEIMQVIDEIDEDEGRINRVGASIVFVFFGILVTVLLIGTNIFSYSLSIHNATDYFDRHKYTQAYNEVYGIDLKDEDIELYDKIQTVMFVNKQLNSYNNYYSIGKYPEALDSLLKGLSRYDKYIELATMLGIDSDLVYVRDQIIAELNRVYHITDQEALDIINSDTKAEYSIKVYNVVLENMNN